MRKNLLEAKMVECGISEKELCMKLGISLTSFWRKKNGINDFYRREMQVIRKVLNLTPEEVDRIFFDDNLR